MSNPGRSYCDLTINGQPLVTWPEATAEAPPRQQSFVGRRLSVLKDIAMPRAEARGMPFEYVIEVTSRCNLVCPMCPREISPDVGNQDMDLDTFRSVLKRIRHAASFIWLAGLGEPMMNKHFMTMIEECHKYGIKTGASTNGTFLTEKWQERLLDSPLDLLIVSFDGTDKETYEKVRVGAEFEKVRDNVREFAKRKVARGVKDPWLILQMIELSHTRGQGEAFQRMWNIPGVDSVRVKKDELQFDESLAFEGQRKRDGHRPCPFLWRGTIYIHWDGAISPCCYGCHDKSFGNLDSAPVEKLWNGSRLQSIRQAHLDGKGMDESFCENCNTFQPGKLPMMASAIVPSLFQKKYAGVVESLNSKLRFME